MWTPLLLQARQHKLHSPCQRQLRRLLLQQSLALALLPPPLLQQCLALALLLHRRTPRPSSAATMSRAQQKGRGVRRPGTPS